MKICIFSRPFYPDVGGLEAIAMILACEFASAGHSVEVVTDTLSGTGADFSLPFRVTRTSSFAGRLRAFAGSDIVLFMNISLQALPVALFSRRLIVLSHHGIYRSSGGMKIRFSEFVKRQTTRFFPNIAVSGFVASRLPGKSAVISNAYPAELFGNKVSRRTKDFVFCGRLVSEKGGEVLIRAFEGVVVKYRDATLTVIGDGPELASLRRICGSLKLTRNIEFTGTLRGAGLVAKLQEHACSVVPSLCDEAFGITALEGIAACDMVLASNRGGLPEAVGGCGILVEPTVESLQRAMLGFLDSHRNGSWPKGKPLDSERVVHLSRHAPARVASKYLALFEHLMN